MHLMLWSIYRNGRLFWIFTTHNNIVYKLLLQLVVVVDRLRSFFNVFFKGKRKRSILCFVTTCVSVEISRSSPSTLEDHEIYVIWSLQKCISNSPCNLMTAVGMKIWLYHLRLHLEQDPK